MTIWGKRGAFMQKNDKNILKNQTKRPKKSKQLRELEKAHDAVVFSEGFQMGYQMGLQDGKLSLMKGDKNNG